MNFIKSVKNRDFRFFKMPKFIFESEKYAHLKSEDIVLYSVILDGISLSASNGDNFRENDGSLYTILTIERAVGYTRMSEKSVRNSFKRLKEAELIHVKRMGLQKPNRIFAYDIESLNGSSYHSGTVTDTSLDWSQLPPNDTDLSDTDLSDLKDTPLTESTEETGQSPQQEKPKRYTVLTNGGFLTQQYASMYKRFKNKDHPDMTLEELQEVEYNLEEQIEELGIDEMELLQAIETYFKTLPTKNNGHIKAFAMKDLKGPLRRLVI